MTCDFSLPMPVKKVISRLNECGYDAYCVGGCVRDFLMGIAPHDFDITTSATPGEVTACFVDCRVIETGVKHGTITVIVDNLKIEITTFRIDGDYTDNRHPDNVLFTHNLADDLARRDFTINAMAYNEDDGLCDIFGGKNHIEKKIISCVGVADKRFDEDALRILRALRFSSTLGFSVDKKTSAAISRKAPLLKNISGERIYSELIKLLCGENVESVLSKFSHVFCVIIPEIKACIGFDQKNPYHKYDVYTHIIKTVTACPNDKIIRLAALFHDIAKPACFTVDDDGYGHARGHHKLGCDIAKETLTRLHVDNFTIDTVTDLIFYHDKQIIPDDRSVKRLISHTSYEFARRLCKLKKADLSAHADTYADCSQIAKIESIIDRLDMSCACVSLKDLNIDGRDLLKIGIHDGVTIGKTLKHLLALVIDDEVSNDHDMLIEAAKKSFAAV